MQPTAGLPALKEYTKKGETEEVAVILDLTTVCLKTLNFSANLSQQFPNVSKRQTTNKSILHVSRFLMR